MSQLTKRRLVQEGEAAPLFSLPAVSREGTISLDDFRDSKAVLLGMLRGVYCPFCRRQMAQLTKVADQLRPIGVETVLVITTAPERARVYFQHYPTSLPIASDPEMAAHRAYGVMRPELTDRPTNWPVTVNPNDLSEVHSDHSWPDVIEATTLLEAVELLDAKDGYTRAEGDPEEQAKTWHQLSGLILIDKDGVVRWTNIEAPGGLADFGNLASDTEIVAAAQRVAP